MEVGGKLHPTGQGNVVENLNSLFVSELEFRTNDRQACKRLQRLLKIVTNRKIIVAYAEVVLLPSRNWTRSSNTVGAQLFETGGYRGVFTIIYGGCKDGLVLVEDKEQCTKVTGCTVVPTIGGAVNAMFINFSKP